MVRAYVVARGLEGEGGAVEVGNLTRRPPLSFGTHPPMGPEGGSRPPASGTRWVVKRVGTPYRSTKCRHLKRARRPAGAPAKASGMHPYRAPCTLATIAVFGGLHDGAPRYYGGQAFNWGVWGSIQPP